jgi:hypothetical protein
MAMRFCCRRNPTQTAERCHAPNRHSFPAQLPAANLAAFLTRGGTRSLTLSGVRFARWLDLKKTCACTSSSASTVIADVHVLVDVVVDGSGLRSDSFERSATLKPPAAPEDPYPRRTERVRLRGLRSSAFHPCPSALPPDETWCERRLNSGWCSNRRAPWD